MSLSSFHGSRLPASAPGIWRPRLPTRDREIAKRWHESHRTRDAFLPFFYLFIYSFSLFPVIFSLFPYCL